MKRRSARDADPTRPFVTLGLTPLEAEVFLHLSGQSAATGYAVAKAIGKPTANVYKALQTLRRKGAVEVEAGDTSVYRAVPGDELLDRLERQFRQNRLQAEEALARMRRPPGDARIYQLRSADQVFERCRNMLSAARVVALVDIFPAPLDVLCDTLEATAARDVRVVIKTYAQREVRGARVVVEPRAGIVLDRWQADWLNLATDGCEMLIALLSREPRVVIQAFWSESPYLSFILANYLSFELTTTSFEIELERAPDLESLRQRFRELRDVLPDRTPGAVRLYRQIDETYDPDSHSG